MNILNKILNKIRKKAYSKNPFNLSRIKKKKVLIAQTVQQKIDQQKIDQQVDISVEDPTMPVSEEIISAIMEDASVQNYFTNQLLLKKEKKDNEGLEKSPLLDVRGFVNRLIEDRRKYLQQTGEVQQIENLQTSTEDPYSSYKVHYDENNIGPDLPGIAFNSASTQIWNEINNDNPVTDNMSEEQKRQTENQNLADFNYEMEKWDLGLFDTALGQPKGKGAAKNRVEGFEVDNRISFFIHNPEYLGEVLQKNPTVVNLLEDQLYNRLKVTPSEGGILEDLKQVGDLKSNEHRRLVNILNNELGPQLHLMLQTLIESNNPDIKKWIDRKGLGKLKEIKNIEKRTIQSPEDEGEGTWDPLDIQGKRQGRIEAPNVESLEKKWKSMDEISKRTSIIGREYIKKDIEGIENLREDTFQEYVDNLSNKYLVEKNAKALDSYNSAEKMNVFSIVTLEQIDNLLESGGKSTKSAQANGEEVVLFHNGFGDYVVPYSLLNNIFEGVPLEERIGIDINDYGEYVSEYREKVKDGLVSAPFNPKWGNMVRTSYISQKLAEMGKIKKHIKDKYKEYPDLKTLKDRLRDVQAINESIYKFSGVSKNDIDENGKYTKYGEMKRDNFISMTLNQSDAYINDLIDRHSVKKMKTPEEQEIENKRVDKNRHNLKAAYGGSSFFEHILGYLYNVIQKNKGLYSPSMIRSFYDTFSPYGTLRSLKTEEGRKKNIMVPDMSNAELSNVVRGENFSNNDAIINDLNRKRLIEKLPWQKEVMGKYMEILRIEKEINTNKEKINRFKEILKEKKQIVESKFYKNINTPKYEKTLKNLINEEQMKEVENFASKISTIPGIFGNNIEETIVKEKVPLEFLSPEMNRNITNYNDRKFVEKFVENWDYVSEIPQRIHTIIGTPALKGLYSAQKSLKKEENKAKNNEARWNIEKKEIWDKIKEISSENGYNLPKSIQSCHKIFKTVIAEYKLLENRIQKLSKIKYNLTKIANTMTVDALINKEINNYKVLFNQLFS